MKRKCKLVQRVQLCCNPFLQKLPVNNFDTNFTFFCFSFPLLTLVSLLLLFFSTMMGGELFLKGGDGFLVEVFCVSFCLTLALSFLPLLLLFPPDVLLTKFVFVLHASPSFEVGLMLFAFALLLVFGFWLLFLFLFSLTLILFLLPFLLLRSWLMPPLVWLLTSSSPPLELSVVVDAESKLSSSLRWLLLWLAFALRCCCCLFFLPLRF